MQKWLRLDAKRRRRFEKIMREQLGADWPHTCNALQQLYGVDCALSGLAPSPITFRGLAIDGQTQSPARYPPSDGWRA